MENSYYSQYTNYVSNPLTSGPYSVRVSNSDDYFINTTVTEPDIVIKGKLILNGTDVSQTLEDAAKVLGVINRDPELEKRYAGLREIARQYEEALEKYKTFEAIKDSK